MSTVDDTPGGLRLKARELRDLAERTRTLELHLSLLRTANALEAEAQRLQQSRAK
jgi:hypothetical protein